MTKSDKVNSFVTSITNKITSLISTHNSNASAHSDIRNTISGKLDKAQGSSKANKNIATDTNGNIITEEKNNHNHSLGDIISSGGNTIINDSSGYSLLSDWGEGASIFNDNIYYYEDDEKVYYHDYEIANVADLNIDWSDIQNKPSTMTPSSHAHGSLTHEGTLNYDITSVNKIAVTDSSNNLKTISKLPANKVTHQDLSDYAQLSDLPTATNELTYNGLSAITIPSGGLSSKTDLNNDVYWNEGRYICSSTNAGSLLSSSLPQASTGFILDVLNHSQGKIQIFTTINTGNPNVYYKIRNTTGTNATSWIQIAKVSDIPSLTNYIQKSNTSGLIKNDGSIDTNSYAKTSQIPDISGKANSADLATVATTGSYNDLSNKPAPTTIASGTNLNTCIEAGEYICNTTTIAKTLTHTPWGDSTSTNAVAFNMQVYKTGQASGKVMISQVIHDYNGNNTYTRTCYANTASNAYLTTGWSNWEGLAKNKTKSIIVNYTDGTTETINWLIE